MSDRWVVRPAIGVLLALTLAPAPALASVANWQIGGHGSALGGRVVSGQIEISPTSGPAGTSVQVRGRNFTSTCVNVRIYFIDSTGAFTSIGLTSHNGVGRLRTAVQIPMTAPTGAGSVRAVPFTFLSNACRDNPLRIGPSAPFTVTQTSFTLRARPD